MSFFGGDTGLTYEDVQRKRKIADAMLAQNRRGSRNVGEGLGTIARALAARTIEKKTGAAMERLTAEADDLYSSLFGGGQSSGGGVSTPTQGATIPRVTTQTEPQAIAGDAMAAVIRQGLIDRGMPPHVADGFVMNARDESGLRTDINEVAPIVPGSRGGYGLMQWTGPRRVALEQYAQSQGKPPSDLNVQLDFLAQELQTSEARAGQAIMSTSDAGSAATAIVNEFLRPAPEHRERRVAQYGGQSAVGGQAGGQPSVQQIAAALANPIIQRDPGKVAVLEALLGKAMQEPERMTPYQQAQIDLAERRLAAETGKEGDGTEYGLTPQFYTDDSGQLKMGVLGKDGTFKEVDLPEGAALQRGIEKLDLGTSFQWYNTMTAEPIGDPIPKNLADAERAKAAGRAEGEAEVATKQAAPKIIEQANAQMALIDSVVNDPALPGVLGKFQGRLDPEGMGGLFLSQEGLNLLPKIKQIGGKEFLAAFESLKGGGQITEREGQAALDAATRLQRYQDEASFTEALMELRAIAERAKLRAQGIDVPEFADPAGYRGNGPAGGTVTGGPASSYSTMSLDELVDNPPSTEAEAAEWNKRFEALQ